MPATLNAAMWHSALAEPLEVDGADHRTVKPAAVDQLTLPAHGPAMGDVLPAVAVEVEHGHRVARGTVRHVMGAPGRILDPP